LDLVAGPHGDLATGSLSVTSVSFQETAAGGSLDWHTAPVRQLVVTMTGTLVFTTRDGQEFLLHSGDVLLAEDTVGSGHSWKLVDAVPWRRVYLVLAPGAPVPFVE
jgi:quercetin dioxygenase-like cupin family protein